MKKILLTHGGIEALKPEAKPYEKMDTDTRNFGVRVLPTGVKTFILFRRWPGSKSPARRSLGQFPDMKLKDARILAGKWAAMAREGIDPAAELRRTRAANEEADRHRKTTTVEAVLTDYLTDKADLKSYRGLERELRRELKPWEQRSILDITEADVRALIGSIKRRGKKAQALSIYHKTKAFFAWAVGNGYGLEVSPMEKIDKVKSVGTHTRRKRVLKDEELFAFWKATGELGYPWGDAYRLIAMTGLRLREVTDARWSEFDLVKGEWTIPPERMKAGDAHIVPLTPAVAEFLKGLPRFEGDYLFTSDGHNPIVSYSKGKAKLDALMPGVENFTVHDLRRTCRTRLSSLPGVSHKVAELILAHGQSELDAVYDQHAYLEEKRAALIAWQAALDRIVNPPPEADVLRFERRTA
jgi:integrase